MCARLRTQCVRLLLVKAADAILATMSGIEAVCAAGEHKDLSISAQGRSKLNVQQDLEELGGGGSNLAAAQVRDLTVRSRWKTDRNCVK